MRKECLVGTWLKILLEQFPRRFLQVDGLLERLHRSHDALNGSTALGDVVVVLLHSAAKSEFEMVAMWQRLQHDALCRPPVDDRLDAGKGAKAFDIHPLHCPDAVMVYAGMRFHIIASRERKTKMDAVAVEWINDVYVLHKFLVVDKGRVLCQYPHRDVTHKRFGNSNTGQLSRIEYQRVGGEREGRLRL